MNDNWRPGGQGRGRQGRRGVEGGLLAVIPAAAGAAAAGRGGEGNCGTTARASARARVRKLRNGSKVKLKCPQRGRRAINGLIPNRFFHFRVRFPSLYPISHLLVTSSRRHHFTRITMISQYLARGHTYFVGNSEYS